MRVLITGDQWAARAGFKVLLNELDASAAAVEAANLEEALGAVEDHGPFELVLLDLDLPGLDGVEGLGRVREKLGPGPVVMLSRTGTRDEILRAIEHGAMGIIVKTAGPDEALKSLGIVLSGGISVPSSAIGNTNDRFSGRLRRRPDDHAAKERIDRLTMRQHEVFSHLAHGLTNADIADELGKSEHTVRIHVSAILKCLGVKNRTQAALIAARHGIAR